MTSDREEHLLRVLTHTSRGFYVCFGILSAVALWGLYGYIVQLRWGLIVTGMRDQTSWGLYIMNFVFFTGISYGAMLISGILRATGAGWRHPITRLSEAIAVFAMCVGGPMVIVDMGRPGRMHYLFTHERIQSAILWDVMAMTAFLVGCVLYLYLSIIPDLPLLSERQELPAWRRKLYRTLTFGWTGTAAEQRLLEKTISRMAIVMIMLAVSGDTVSWIFSTTLRPGWNSSNFGAYFVMGAIYSGTAAVALAMYILVRVLHLEDYLKPVHFRNIGILLVTFCLLYLFLNVTEYLTSAYKVEGPEKLLMHQLFFGDYAELMWTTQALCIVIPLIMVAAVLTLKRLQRFTPSVVALASVLVIIGSWGKRYLIIVPTLSTPYLPIPTDTAIPYNPSLPWDWLHYRPSWVEWSVTFGGVAVFALMYMLFTKLFPMVSIWETRQYEAQVEPAVAPAPQPAPQRLGSIPTTTIILIACLLFGAGHARAAQKKGPPKQPEATTLSLEWKQVATPAPTNEAAKQTQSSARGTSGANRFFGRLFGWLPAESNDHTQGAPSILITATLLGANGQPLAYQVVGLSLKTSFGTLDYGKRPTNADGKAQFPMQDRRYGQYPVVGTYDGGDQFAAAHAVTSVDFGPRPEISLPSGGVLIAPYATAWIGLPFLGFFGLMWFAFIYFGVYVLFWRLPQIRKDQAKSR